MIALFDSVCLVICVFLVSICVCVCFLSFRRFSSWSCWSGILFLHLCLYFESLGFFTVSRVSCMLVFCFILFCSSHSLMIRSRSLTLFSRPDILSSAWLILHVRLFFEISSWVPVSLHFISMRVHFSVSISICFSQFLDCLCHFHQPYIGVFLDIAQIFIPLKFFIQNLPELFLFASSLNSLNSLKIFFYDCSFKFCVFV